MPGIGKAAGRVSDLVEKGMAHCLDGREALGGRVLEQSCNEVDGFYGRFAEDLVSLGKLGSPRIEDEATTCLAKWVRLDLWKFVLHVVRVHGADLLLGGCAQDLDDLHQLIYARFPRKEGLTEHELCHDTSRGPHIWATGLAIDSFERHREAAAYQF